MAATPSSTPTNSKNVITEYTDLAAFKSTDGGANWHGIAPSDPDPRFIAPIVMDRTNSNHLVAGGAFVWNSESGVAGTTANTGAATDWKNIFDVRTALGGNAASQVTALDATTVGDTQYVAAAWCGPCNPSFPSGTGFQAGIVMLSNSGGSWHATAQECTGSSACPNAGLPNRYITGIKIDTADPSHGYLSLSGYSRHWIVGPDDPGVGHVYQTTHGRCLLDRRFRQSAGHPGQRHRPERPGAHRRAPTSASTPPPTTAARGADWAPTFPTSWSARYSSTPKGNLVAATHGRGIWTIPTPAR